MYLNKVQLIGNIGKDPTINTTQGGMVANFSLATNEISNNQTYTKWHRIVAWNGVAKVAQYLAKGRLVYIEGRLEYPKYNGVEYARIVAHNIRFLDANKGQVQAQVGNTAPEQAISEQDAAMYAGYSQETLF